MKLLTESERAKIPGAGKGATNEAPYGSLPENARPNELGDKATQKEGHEVKTGSEGSSEINCSRDFSDELRQFNRLFASAAE
jgi:hypothetical protein